MRNRRTLGAVTLLLCILAFWGLLRIRREIPGEWGIAIPQQPNSESVQLDVEAALASHGDSEGPKSGATVPLARFNRADGSSLTVIAQEGQFFDAAIEPREIWQSLGRSLILVSSVDENRSGNGSSSGPITRGCSVPPSRVELQLGQATLTPCRGPYHNGGHIDWVATVSPIIWTASIAGKQPCWDRYGIDVSNGYQACVGNAVLDSFQDLFVQLRNRPDLAVDAIVTPAVGTGAGGLSRAGFYQTLLVNVLVEELKKDYRLPGILYLQIRRWESPNRWPETRTALAAAISKSVAKWKFDTDHKSPDSEWLSLTGVAVGGAILFLLLFLGVSVPVLTRDLEVLIRDRSPMQILMWASTAVGLVSMFKSVIMFFPTKLNPHLQVAAGAIAALFCSVLLRASRDFTKSIEGTQGEENAVSKPAEQEVKHANGSR